VGCILCKGCNATINSIVTHKANGCYGPFVFDEIETPARTKGSFGSPCEERQPDKTQGIGSGFLRMGRKATRTLAGRVKPLFRKGAR